MIVKAQCNSCDRPFTWHRDYASRHAIRRTCRLCHQVEAAIQRDVLRQSDHQYIDGRITIRTGHNRYGCPSCSLLFSQCDCQPRRNPC